MFTVPLPKNFVSAPSSSEQPDPSAVLDQGDTMSAEKEDDDDFEDFGEVSQKNIVFY